MPGTWGQVPGILPGRLIPQTWSTLTSAVGNRGPSPCRDCVASASDGVTGAATAQAGPWGDAYLPVTGFQAYHPGVDDLRAIPRIDIYGEDVARHVLNGDYRDIWVAASAAGTVYTARSGAGGSNYSFALGSGGCSSVTAGGGGGWSNSMWSVHAYGGMIVRPGGVVTVTGI